MKFNNSGSMKLKSVENYCIHKSENTAQFEYAHETPKRNKRKNYITITTGAPTKRSSLCVQSIWYFLLLLNSVIAIIMWATNWYQLIIYKVQVLSNNSLNVELWKNPTWQPLLSIYIFNYTNVDRILEYSEKPNVKEIGPYVFREKANKVNVTFYQNGTVSYQVRRNYTFLPEKTQGSLNDIIYTPNVVLLSAAQMIKEKSWLVRKGFGTFISATKVSAFNNFTVNDFIMGPEDWFSNIGLNLKRASGEDVPSKFGLLTKRMGLSSNFTMNTGKYNTDLVGQFEYIDGKRGLGKWEDEECDKLNGGDGTIYSPTLVSRKQTLNVFSEGSCRVAKLYYEKETTTHGLPTMKYNLDPRLMDPSNENNSCFCPQNNCSPNGTQNVAPCAFGSPIFVSLPHFASSDKTLQDSISGLAPGVNRNINTFHIHKTFGVLLSGRTGIQINALVSYTGDVSALDGLKVGTYLPIAWLEMDLTSPPQDMIQLLKRLSITISSVEYFLKYITILIAFICSVKLIQSIYMSAKL